MAVKTGPTTNLSEHSRGDAPARQEERRGAGGTDLKSLSTHRERLTRPRGMDCRVSPSTNDLASARTSRGYRNELEHGQFCRPTLTLQGPLWR